MPLICWCALRVVVLIPTLQRTAWLGFVNQEEGHLRITTMLRHHRAFALVTCCWLRVRWLSYGSCNSRWLTPDIRALCPVLEHDPIFTGNTRHCATRTRWSTAQTQQFRGSMTSTIVNCALRLVHYKIMLGLQTWPVASTVRLRCAQTPDRSTHVRSPIQQCVYPFVRECDRTLQITQTTCPQTQVVK